MEKETDYNTIRGCEFIVFRVFVECKNSIKTEKDEHYRIEIIWKYSFPLIN